MAGADPGPAARRPPAAAERLAAGAFAASTACALGLAVTYWRGGQVQLEGALLAGCLGGLGVGTVVWAKRFLPPGPVAEERGRLESSPEEVEAFTAAFAQGEEALQRRTLLVRMFAAAVGALGVAMLFPLRSLGPRPGRGLFRTAFAPGTLLVREDDQPVRPADIPVDGVVTVWPEGHVGDADAPTLLVRVADPSLFGARVRRDWTVGGIVAYSKLCTHTGCPVGLYQAQEHLLLCPCHQSTFEVLEGARPVFGPAARPLPQLPLGLDGSGRLVATGDFPEPVGVGFWDRGR